jgi:predicted Zn-dependent protease
MKRIYLLIVLILLAIVMPSCTFDDITKGGQAMGALFQGMRPLTYDEMSQMSLGISAKLAAMYPVCDDPALTKYVNMVAMTVGHYSDRPDYNYRVLVLNAPGDVNAFTTADGRIFVTTGLLAMVRDESELAGVLGHEIAHAARGHVTKAIANQRLKAGMVQAAAIMLEDQGAFSAIANGGFDIIALNPRSRQQESEADTYGMYYAEGAGYDPRGLVQFLERARDNQAIKSSSMKVFDTHPDIAQRIADINTSIAINFRPTEHNPIMMTTPSGQQVERSQYFTAALRAR